MGRWGAGLALCGAVACGGRTTLGGVIEERDAAVVAPDASEAGQVTRQRATCFPGGVDGTPFVTCEVSAPVGPAAACSATLSCSEGKVMTMRCTDGLCRCDNPPYDVCDCRPPVPSDPCGKVNCCWD